MRLLIVLATLATLALAEIYDGREYYQYRGPPAPLSSDGTVMDTPEVARARAAHLAMHAETLDRLRKARTDYEMYENNDMSYLSPPMMDEPVMQNRQRQRSFGPPVRDERMMGSAAMADLTRARAASKASELYDFDTYNGPKSVVYLGPVRLAYKHVPHVVYRGPFAPLGPDGRVVETPEVARARDAHMKAHARAVALSAQNELYY